ncbi:hypothetical protein [Enterobacter sp. 118C5]|uniref:hypothetical protein n=1 Tax=Enterobacter TaxID=547 RepID=UPI002A831EB2|nr:hypothetical protein [Enterobacter sp. 118C5]
MLSVQVFKNKWLYLSVAIALVGYGLWRVIDNFLYLEQRIIHRESIGSFSTLYITESSAGATTSNVYKYYLYPGKSSEENFLKEVRNGYEPFLMTTASDVKFNIEENAIHLKVAGDIFKFNNVAGHTFIYLDASPF